MPDVAEQFLSPILSLSDVDQFGMLINKSSRAQPVDKCLMPKQLEQERDVCFDAANSKLGQHTVHSLDDLFEATFASGHFNQHRIVKRINRRTGKGRPGIKPNAHSAA